jgi:hypothetical protein
MLTTNESVTRLSLPGLCIHRCMIVRTASRRLQRLVSTDKEGAQIELTGAHILANTHAHRRRYWKVRFELFLEGPRGWIPFELEERRFKAAPALHLYRGQLRMCVRVSVHLLPASHLSHLLASLLTPPCARALFLHLALCACVPFSFSACPPLPLCNRRRASRLIEVDRLCRRRIRTITKTTIMSSCAHLIFLARQCVGEGTGIVSCTRARAIHHYG